MDGEAPGSAEVAPRRSGSRSSLEKSVDASGDVVDKKDEGKTDVDDEKKANEEEGEVTDEPKVKKAEEEEEEGETKEDDEDMRKDLSDIDSEDDILNKEGKEEQNEDELESSAAKSGSRRSTEEARDRSETDLLEGISDEDLDVSDDDETKSAKAKMVDALDVDWSKLMVKQEAERPRVKGSLKKRYSTLSMLKRVGLSKNLMGEEAYNKFVEEANEGAEGNY